MNAVDFVFNGKSFDLVSKLYINPLGSGQSTVLRPRVEVDLCIPETYSTSVEVTGAPTTGGDECTATDEVSFGFSP